MDILKKLINNPGLQHVAEIVIGHLDKEVARNLVGNQLAGLADHELLSEEEQDFLMKTLRKPMYVEAKAIFDEMLSAPCSTRRYETFPNLTKKLEELKNDDQCYCEDPDCVRFEHKLQTFKQFQEILSLLEEAKMEHGVRFFNRYFDQIDVVSQYTPLDLLEALREYVRDYSPESEDYSEEDEDYYNIYEDENYFTPSDSEVQYDEYDGMPIGWDW